VRRDREIEKIEEKRAHVVAHHVDAGECHEDLAGRRRAGLLVVNDGDDELEERAEGQAEHQDGAAAAVADDDERVEEDGQDAHGAEHVAHAERVGHLGHGQEVGFVGCGFASLEGTRVLPEY
jgi:hypothetical protein